MDELSYFSYFSRTNERKNSGIEVWGGAHLKIEKCIFVRYLGSQNCLPEEKMALKKALPEENLALKKALPEEN